MFSSWLLTYLLSPKSSCKCGYTLCMQWTRRFWFSWSFPSFSPQHRLLWCWVAFSPARSEVKIHICRLAHCSDANTGLISSQRNQHSRNAFLCFVWNLKTHLRLLDSFASSRSALVRTGALSRCSDLSGWQSTVSLWTASTGDSRQRFDTILSRVHTSIKYPALIFSCWRWCSIVCFQPT